MQLEKSIKLTEPRWLPLLGAFVLLGWLLALNASQALGAPAAAKPAKVVLVSPANKAALSNSTPTFIWDVAADADTYIFQLAKDIDFKKKVETAAAWPDTEYTSAGQPDRVYYWRVRGVSSGGVKGPWSAIRKLTIDTVAPAVPVLLKPVDDAVTGTFVKFKWAKAAGAKTYELRLTRDEACADTIFGIPAITSELFYETGLVGDDSYFWCVEARDKAGNLSGFSIPFGFTIP